MGNIDLLLDYLKEKEIELYKKKTKKILFNPVVKFIKAIIGFKMGFIIVPFTNEIIHKNVFFVLK